MKGGGNPSKLLTTYSQRRREETRTGERGRYKGILGKGEEANA